jgi:hypothetical protein
MSSTRHSDTPVLRFAANRGENAAGAEPETPGHPADHQRMADDHPPEAPPPPVSPLPNPAATPAEPVAVAKPRPRGRPFLPGNAGGGRRKQSAQWKAEMRKGCENAPKVLMVLMYDRQTPRETRRKIAEFFITWMYGRPATAISNPDGSALFPPATPTDNPVVQLLARITARRNAAGAGGTAGASPVENAPPGASGEAPGGSAA